jgi:transposase
LLAICDGFDSSTGVGCQGRGRGVRVLRSIKGTGRPRKLTEAQERQVFRWVNGKRPDQYGFDFGLWTLQIVQELLVNRFDVKLSLVGFNVQTVGKTGMKRYQRTKLTPLSPRFARLS